MDNIFEAHIAAQKVAMQSARLGVRLDVNGWMIKHAGEIPLAALEELAKIITKGEE